MTNENRSNVAIPQAVIDSVTNHLTAIRTELAPYLTSLTEDQRQTILKMSDKSETFVGKSLDYTSPNPEFMPAFATIPDFQMDFDNATKFGPAANLAVIVANDLNDIVKVAGHEAYIAALLYYNNVLQADKRGVPAARPIYAELSKRYPGRSKKETPPAAPNP